MVDNNRPPVVLRNVQTLYNTGRLGGTGYLSILPADQGVEHSASASFAASPLYFDPKDITRLAIEAGYNCMVPTYDVLTSVSHRYVYHIPFLVKLNHNKTLGYPTEYDQTLYANAEQAFNMGAVAVGATIYFSLEQSYRQVGEISAAFERAHELSLITVLWAYLHNPAFKKDDVSYHVSADLIGQADHLAVTTDAGIVRQRIAENNSGYRAVNFDYTDGRMYSELTSDNPIDLVYYQLANCYMSHTGLIGSGDAADEEADLTDGVCAAMINKRTDGMGLILGRKAFKKSMTDGVKLIDVMQSVYLDGKMATVWQVQVSLGSPVARRAPGLPLCMRLQAALLLCQQPASDMLIGYQVIGPVAFKGRQGRRLFVSSIGRGGTRAVVLTGIMAGDHTVNLAVYHVTFYIDKPSENLSDAAARGQSVHLHLIDKPVFEDRTLRAQGTSADKNRIRLSGNAEDIVE